MSMCVQRPTVIRRLVLNDIGALIGLEGLNRLLTYAGKNPDVKPPFLFISCFFFFLFFRIEVELSSV